MKVYLAYHKKHKMYIAMTNTSLYCWFNSYEKALINFNKLTYYDNEDPYTVEEWLANLATNNMSLIAEFSSDTTPELFL